MIRQLTTLVLAGILGTLVLSGNAEACHKKKCGCAPAPVACAPVAVTCAKPVKMKKCGGCHKKHAATASCAMPVQYSSYSYGYGYGYSSAAPSGQYAMPQH